MKNVVKLLLVSLVVFSTGSLLAQYTQVEPKPWELAPQYANPISPYVQTPISMLFPNSRAFCYVAYQGTLGPSKFFLNAPGTITNISVQSSFFAGGDWVPGTTGRWYYLTYSPAQVGYCDTTTGTNTILASVSITGPSIGLAYDPASDTLFALTTAPNNLYWINKTTGAATLRTPITGVGTIIDGAFSNGGQLYGIELQGAGNLGKINKYTGVWTTVGPLGIIPIYAQGSAFDRTDNKFYWASYVSSGQLRTIDTNTGASTLIGPFQNNSEVDGLAIPYAGVTYAHDIGAGPFLSFPVMFNVGVQYAIKAKISNFGTSNETGIPVKFFVNGTQVNSTTLNLNAGANDSVSFNWTPPDTLFYTLAIASALSNDEYRGNDTVKSTVRVFPQGTVFNCVGTGTTAVGWPFYTFYMDSRTDILYLGSELGFGASTINRIGFNVVSAASQVMNGFKIKMQNTAATSISSFTSTGWTTVYDAPYTVPGTGWQYINLSPGFSYNGTNLLVEICFNNSSYTSNTTVYATTASGRVAHQHSDLPSGDGCVDIVTPSPSYTTLPNVCLYGIVGTNQGSNEIPKVFSLSQNYPNPFNPSTVINYTIPKTSMVKLVVYDILGREVTTLVNEMNQPGSYVVRFDASNLASGLYIYKIQAGDFTDVKKMLFVK